MSLLIPLEVICAVDIPCRLGESPVWSAQEQALYWVDIPEGRLHRWSHAGGEHREPHEGGAHRGPHEGGVHRQWQLPAAIGSLALRERGGLLLALKTGLHTFDPDTGALERLCHPEADRPELRLNDGKVSPEGRFWVGSMDDGPERQPLGSLWRLDTDHRCMRMVTGQRVPNGLAWSPDGRTMYRADTRALTVWRHDYDPASGAIGEAKVFVVMQPDWGRPDGAAVDMEGCYWNAGVGAGRLNRFSPEGELMGFVPLPVSHPTMPCFGGPDLRTLYVTSMRNGVAAELLAQHPLSGSVLALPAPVAGVPVAAYRG